MSIKALNGALSNDGLSTPQFAVIMLLANHADAAGECFPSYPYLMRKTGLSERGVRKALAELEAIDLVVRRHPKSASGAPLRVRFFLPFAAEDEGRGPGTICRASPAPDAAPPGTICRAGPAPDAGPYKDEPPTKPSDEPGRARIELAFSGLSAAWSAVSPGRVSPVKARAGFEAELGTLDPEAIEEAGRRYLAEDPDVRRLKTAISLHTWLAERRFEPWLIGPPRARRSAGRWDGPPAIREALAAAQGEDWCGSWLDRAVWDPHRNAIIASTGLAADRLAEALPPASRAALGIHHIEGGRS